MTALYILAGIPALVIIFMLLLAWAGGSLMRKFDAVLKHSYPGRKR